jgi:hypothetical protein
MTSFIHAVLPLLTLFHADTFPTPTGIPDMLFYVQRTQNTNTIIYQLNVDGKDQVNKEHPVNIFWMRYADNKGKADLSYLQRTYAYGLKTKDLGNDKYELRFVSYKKTAFYLTRSERTKEYHVYGTVKNKMIEINRIFVQIEGGTFWFPNVVYVEFKGVDPDTGEKIIERFKP